MLVLAASREVRSTFPPLKVDGYMLWHRLRLA